MKPEKLKEEALKRGEELLRTQPDLKSKTSVSWYEDGAGANFVMLCELLKINTTLTDLVLISDEIEIKIKILKIINKNEVTNII